MSVDFNSIINKAFEQAAKSRANRLAISQGIINKDTVREANKSFSYSVSSDLSMEDIAKAIKERNDKKEIDNKFVTNYQLSEKGKKVEKIVSQAQNTIQEVSQNTEIASNRLSDVSKDLAKDIRNIF
ncbi:MAG: hypothetical protein KatS3mg068_1194 [Candidatus Sericytochromatia bacterium]|nr:MAG: hypothetical protein KatS3mg068_1194 [Candidatus Sericytochromatia bacterium]